MHVEREKGYRNNSIKRKWDTPDTKTPKYNTTSNNN